MNRKIPRTRTAAPQAVEKIRFTCPCGAGLRVPVSRVNGHGRCPVCMARLLLSGTQDRQGRWRLQAVDLGDRDSSGRTFLMEEGVDVSLPPRRSAPKPATKSVARKGGYRIEDHFREIPERPKKISFACPCGKRLAARPEMVDRRGKCPACGARLLLVARTGKSGKVEIRPMALDAPSSGETMLIE